MLNLKLITMSLTSIIIGLILRNKNIPIKIAYAEFYEQK